MNKKIGIIGLSTMGGNLAKNFADKGVSVSVYNRTYEKTALLENINNIQTTKTLDEFLDSLGENKIILILVKAGEATDAVINKLSSLINEQDIIVDLGNANYQDSLRRQQFIANYYTCGISGGEKGARHGASLMLSGPKANKERLVEILKLASATDFQGMPTIAYFEEGVSGNIVKTVHNGIEYAVMQVLSELYSIMRNGMNMKTQDISHVFQDWSELKKDYLTSVMSEVLKRGDLIDETKPIIDSKGTGKWTAQLALQNDIYSTVIPLSYNIRLIKQPISVRNEELKCNLKDLSTLYDLAYSYCLQEGLNIITSYGDSIDLEEVKRVWQGGCIIRNINLTKLDKLDYTQYSEAFIILLQTQIPLPLLNAINQNCLIMKYGMSGAPLLAIARDVFGSHGFYNLKDEKIFLEW
jgi:6-phosphogluconate dehydrogenase